MKGTPSSTLKLRRENSEDDAYNCSTEFAGSITTASLFNAGAHRARGGAEWTSKVSSNGKPKPHRPKKTDHAFRRQQQSSPRKTRATKTKMAADPAMETVQLSTSVALTQKPSTQSQQLRRLKEKRKLIQKQQHGRVEDSKEAVVSKTKTEAPPKHYQTAQVRPRVRFATPTAAKLERDVGKLATPFSPEKLM